MMYAVIALNLLGFTVQATTNAMVSAAASADTQGQAMGSVSSLNSLTAVIAPLIGAPLLAMVSHLPPGDWRIGMPFYCPPNSTGKPSSLAVAPTGVPRSSCCTLTSLG